jgi:Raf kinase inhibitor-like YbhB/YbcL family protein
MRAVLVAAALTVFVSPAFALQLTSPDIKDGVPIAQEQLYTRCGGSNVSPALAWSGAPAGTKSFAVTAIDLSVKPNGWSHWIVLDLPPTATSLGKGAALPPGAKAMTSDFGDASYDGPCPPPGSGVHQYQFTVWALGTPAVQLPARATAMQVMAALEKKAVAKASITGTYQR